MRVLLVTHRYPPDGLGGVERYTEGLAAELVKAGDLVSIAARRCVGSSSEPRTIRERLSGGTSLYRFEGGRVDLDDRLAHDERLEPLFTAVMIEAAPDVVHFNHLMGLSPRFIEIAHRMRSAVVLSLHDFYFACPLVHLKKKSGELCAGPDGGRECGRTCFADMGPDSTLRWELRTTYYRRLLTTSRRIICYSRYVSSFFQGFIASPAHLHIIPHGVRFKATDAIRPAESTPKARGTLNLAFCGTVSPHKGPHVILDALQVAKLDSVSLLVIGLIPPPHQGYVRDLRKQAAMIPGLTLRFYGAYERDELVYLLDHIDCAIVPSLVPESGGIVPREALARGVPVLVARLGALPELVVEGENGFTFDPHDEVELASILRRLAHDDDLVCRLREGACRTPVVTDSDHARAVRLIYRDAIEDLLKNGVTHCADVSEAGFLYGALAEHCKVHSSH
jgi:glycosyltransferase involved in cell wall biosynthesis